MKDISHMYRLFVLTVIFGVMIIISGCSAPQGEKPVTEPVAKPEPTVIKEPGIDELRKPVSADAEIFKATAVLKNVGTLKKKSITFDKYKQLTGNNSNAAVDPDWFYDTYMLDFNENNHWVTATLGTSKYSKAKDARIHPIIEGMPESSISMTLKTPSKQSYILLDANADGILDYVKESGKPADVKKIDIALLDSMQEKYTWLLNILKKYYKKTYK